MAMFSKPDKFGDVAKPAVSHDAKPAASHDDALREQFPRSQPHPARSFTQRATLGKTVVIEGSVTAGEDLEILGRIKGHVAVAGHTLTVGEGAVIEADIHASDVVVQGEVHGPVEAEVRLEIAAGGVVIGDVKAPSLVISDGATLKGSVEMDATHRPAPPAKKEKPAVKASPFKVAAENGAESEVAAG